jgi:hypothetical protein
MYVLNLGVLVFGWSFPVQAQGRPQPKYVQGEIIVKYRRYLPDVEIGRTNNSTQDSIAQEGNRSTQDSVAIRNGRQTIHSRLPINPHTDVEIVKVDQKVHVIGKERMFPRFSATDTLSFSKQGRAVKLSDLSGVYRVHVPQNANIDEVLARYRALPQVEYAEPSFITEVGQELIPNDSDFGKQ